MADAKKQIKALQDFRSMDEKSLQAKLAELRTSLVEHYRANAVQELPSPAVITKTRKDIAKALTVLHEKQLAPAKEQEK